MREQKLYFFFLHNRQYLKYSTSNVLWLPELFLLFKYLHLQYLNMDLNTTNENLWQTPV